jgi:hypothetical protein
MPKSDVLERRKYIRLGSVFPVEIYLRNSHNNSASHLIQAFTCDVSLGGLCLSINDPDSHILAIATTGSTPFDVSINMPIIGSPIKARVRVAWHEIRSLERHRQLLLGVFYDEIAPRDRQKILASARRIKWMPKLGVLAIVLLACLLAASDYRATQLRSKNQELIRRFYKVQEEGQLYERSATKMDAKYADLKARLADSMKTIGSLQAQFAALKIEDPAILAQEKAVFDERLAAALDEKSILEGQLKGIEERRVRASKLLDDVKGKKRQLEQAATENMYQWLKTHRNRFTGLVMSFEGDPSLRDWAFTYDQSLAAQVFFISGDKEQAAQILAFYRDKAAKRNGGFVNAYNVITGTPSEEVIHLGPNIWIGIAAVRYAEKTGDDAYLGLAESIARWVTGLKDKEGGLRGGPDVTWYSTEHNLDAYALYKMLYALTGKEIYNKEMAVTLKWIKDNTYSAKEGRMNRGKGDSTIATDTMAWAIAAIGPATLAKEGMDPESIMKFAEEHCLVSTSFNRPDGEAVNINGFDFAKSRNIARNGVISTEWTAQMIISYRVMADHYDQLGEKEKAKEYAGKSDYYLGELDKMIISSPSPSGQGAGCLPYASQPNSDTGHGWRTPGGQQTGAVAGTAYTIFAKKGYNPLSL